MYTLLLVINVISAFVMVGVILLQHGRGAEQGATAGRSQSALVSASGSTNFLSRTTSILALTFFSTALALSIVTKQNQSNDILESLSTKDTVEQEVILEVPKPSDDN